MNKKDMYDVKMIGPVPNLRSKLEEILKRSFNLYFKFLRFLTIKNQNLLKTRDLLLPKLRSGK
ncbi:hypothetical protein EO93_12625 [Methanosarcina sp. 1.H.A.2.2]|nr:hypothetical protein EO93_12625 [Methanosarcina sp. 1.H.A.2.2]